MRAPLWGPLTHPRPQGLGEAVPTGVPATGHPLAMRSHPQGHTVVMEVARHGVGVIWS